MVGGVELEIKRHVKAVVDPGSDRAKILLYKF
jgi:hypothetical protein